MADVTPEDGTGLSNSDSYVDEDDLLSYIESYHGEVAQQYSRVELSRALRRASQFIDIQFEYGGSRSKAAQAMEFPRTGLTDSSGYDATGVPARVVKACCELAWKALSENLMPDMDRANKVRSETVGPLSTTYADDAPERKLFTVAEKLLSPFVTSGLYGQEASATDKMNGPYGASTATPFFTLGMQS